jgi:hypothetical protein
MFKKAKSGFVKGVMQLSQQRLVMSVVMPSRYSSKFFLVSPHLSAHLLAAL